ncbi:MULTISPECIES: hypothetical protein [Bacillus]|uniref:hypothetical protein n=1 Tax=Bacillus TaxID=1386 RepID=UPI0011A7CCBD|nr:MULTISPECIES: hypothetical protein [Bacillus]
MPAYSLKTVRKPFAGGKNILASEHLQFIEGAATLDAKKIGKKYLDVGTAIMRNLTTGKFELYADGTGGALPEGYDEFSLLNIDVNVDGENDVVVGEVIVRGSVYDAKLPTNVTATFKKETKAAIRYVKEI